MCGIVGYIGKTGSLQMLVDGLKRLEYRGYDSAGIAFLNGCGLEVCKTKGKLKDLQCMLPTPAPDCRVGLGHTRWATHGGPSTINAHPHRVEGIAVVHNGIIENYRELRSTLESEGHRFLSETDTEVVPQLISKHRKQGHPIREAIRMALSQLKGSYALGIISEDSPDVLYAVRKGSPLVLGLGKEDYYFASDIPAILPYTRKFIFLEDGQICTLTGDGVDIRLVESDTVISYKDKIVEIDWTPEMAEKDGHDHFMHKEIFEQPRAISHTIGERMNNPLSFLEELGIRMQRKSDVQKLHIVSCGTSYHAALVGKYMIENLARVPVNAEIASEYRYRNPIIDNSTLFVAITQSGETADTLAAQREAKRLGARTLTICNVVGSTSTREADAVLHTRSGPEIGVASTKTFTSQMAALCLLALGMGIKKGCLSESQGGSLKSYFAEVPALVQKTLQKDAEIKALAKTLIHAKDFLYLARGINFPLALEGALKLKEISYIHAEGYPAGEMKHGPIALIEKGLPVVVIATSNDLFEKIFSNIEEVKARGGRVIAVTDSPEALKGKADDIIEVPKTHPLFTPFINAIPLQLLAYHVGVLRNCDVDQPRNLAKSVTVE
ncbi:MAG TPA: glutamine--fructose-6-phosphate transaminase (isomerizing) [Nitrospirota bacterium]|nr:glutamine--fructose-6-phosphate transaminase (isomerizing) [Nitrospirota bacterium]